MYTIKILKCVSRQFSPHNSFILKNFDFSQYLYDINSIFSPSINKIYRLTNCKCKIFHNLLKIFDIQCDFVFKIILSKLYIENYVDNVETNKKTYEEKSVSLSNKIQKFADFIINEDRNLKNYIPKDFRYVKNKKIYKQFKYFDTIKNS